MKARSTLRGRLIASYFVVVAALLAAGFLTVRLLTPTLAQRRVQAGPGAGAGPGGPGGPANPVPTQIQDAYNEALTIALIVAGAIGVLLALGLAYWLSRRILGRVREIQSATHRMAAGDYDVPLPEPSETELAELTRSINSLGANLAATEEARARLVSDLAHELRNPLTTIEGYMEGLIDGVLPAEAATYETVAAEAHRLKRLTDDLSLLSRVQEGALQLNPTDVDLGDICSAVVERLRPQFEAKGVSIATGIGEPLPVHGDRGRLHQIITNIVGNALVHTPDGGTVSVKGSRDASGCRIEVSDTGSGIPRNQLKTVFDRFTRLDPNSDGTGIGLHIARSLARAHGGEITARSGGTGMGSTFTLELPAG